MMRGAPTAVFCFTVVLSSAAAQPPRPALFDHPEILCSALEDLGIHTTPWAPVGNPPRPNVRALHQCEYRSDDYFSATVVPPGSRSSTYLIYRVSSIGPEPDSISLSVSYPNADRKEEARGRFQAALKRFFDVIGRDIPRGLASSIEYGKTYRYHESYGVLWFSLIARERPKEWIFWFQLRKSAK